MSKKYMKKNSLKSVFFGTPRFSTLVLDRLKEKDITPTLIVTAPDSPSGRKLILTPPEVKVWAEEHGVPIIQPKALDDNTLAEIWNTDWDIFIVVAYGKILPKDILDLPKYKTLNVHPSLLPKYRGASPVASQILSDDRKTGVTVMLMDEEVDHGPILTQASIEIDEGEWPPRKRILEEMLASEGGELLAETIPKWIEGDLTLEPQNEALATYTKKITKKDGEISLEDNPRKNFLKIRAYDEWPGAYFFTHSSSASSSAREKHTRVKITDAEYDQKGDTLIIKRVIPEGKREMPYDDFLRG